MLRYINLCFHSGSMFTESGFISIKEDEEWLENDSRHKMNSLNSSNDTLYSLDKNKRWMLPDHIKSEVEDSRTVNQLVGTTQTKKHRTHFKERNRENFHHVSNNVVQAAFWKKIIPSVTTETLEKNLKSR